MKAIRVANSLIARAARAVRRAFLPCLLVFVGTCLLSAGIGYLVSGGWVPGLRVGLVLGSVFVLATFLLANPVISADESALASFAYRPSDAPLSDPLSSQGSINPATGLPMVGGVDTAGNLYGSG